MLCCPLHRSLHSVLWKVPSSLIQPPPRTMGPINRFTLRPSWLVGVSFQCFQHKKQPREMKNETDTMSTVMLPRAALTECLEPSRFFRRPETLQRQKNVVQFFSTFDWLSQLPNAFIWNFQEDNEKLKIATMIGTSGNNELKENKIQTWRTIAVSTSTKATNNWMTLAILSGIIPECGTLSLLHAIDRNTHISLLPPSRMQRYDSKNQSSNCFNNSCRVRKLRRFIIGYRMLRQSCTCLRY